MAVGRAHHWVNACPGAYGRAASRLHTPFLILTLYDSRFAGQRRVSRSRSRHLERMPVTLSASFGSGSTDAEILRCAQDDSQDTAQVLSREVLSPNVWMCRAIVAYGARATGMRP